MFHLVAPRVSDSLVVRNLLLLIIAVALSLEAQAQSSQTLHDGYTPTGLEQGAPAGSYPLSGFETINPYNGNLSVALPLMHIGGRGSAGHTIILPIDLHWEVIRDSVTSNGIADDALFRSGDTWRVGYSPGFLLGTSAADRPVGPSCPPGDYRYFLTRLRFIMPDGKEAQLYDKKYQGAPQAVDIVCNPNAYPNRGKVFVTGDGESMTFISDTDILDIAYSTSGFADFAPSGVLFMKDGTRYRIDNSNVSWIRDRNGNKVSFTYEAPPSSRRLLSITDSLNRQISITYATTSTGYDEITFNGFGGVTRSLKVWYSPLQAVLRPDFVLKKYNELFPDIYNYSLYNGNYYQNPTLVSKVELPDHRAYQFYYSSYGEIARIILPTGGGLDYEYSGVIYGINDVNHIPMILRRCSKRTVYNSLNAATLPNNPPSGTRERIDNYVRESSEFIGPTVVRVEHLNDANVLLAQEKHYYYGYPFEVMVISAYTPVTYSPWPSGKEFKTESFDIANGVAGGALRRNEDTWSPSIPNPYPDHDTLPAPNPKISETINTMADSNLVARQSFSYDQYNNQTDAYEYDFGTGAAGILIRQTHTDYVTTNNGISYATVNNSNWQPDINQPSAEKTIHIRNLPTEQTVKDANGVLRSRTTYEYDNYTRSGCNAQNIGCDHDQLTNRNPITGIYARVDNPSASYDPTADYYRGNVTSASRYLLANSGLVATDTPLTSFALYDIAGNVIAAKDPKGNFSQISYSSTFQYAYPTGTTSPVPDPNGGFGSNQVLTTATDYDFSTGKVKSSMDANSKTIFFEYNDPLDRLTKVARPIGGGETHYEYGLGDGSDQIVPDNRYIRTRTKQSASPVVYLEDNVRYDGLGRTIRSSHCEVTGSNGCSKWSARDLQYDALGRSARVSNPEVVGGTDFRAALPTNCINNTSICWTTTAYDALSRVTNVTTPDGSHVDTLYSGNKVTVTDQAMKQRSSVTDALGRLTQINEAPNDSSYNYQTNYTYDVLGNLTLVRQGGFPTGGSPDPTVQFRRFYYDSLSRLAYANNPEQNATIGFNPPGETGVMWTMKYDYDPNSNLVSRTDARNITATYAYDALNRNTQVAYNDGITPAVQRFYDTAATNGKGRLQRVESGGTDPAKGAKTAINSYDDLGRVTSQTQSFRTSSGWTDYTVTRSNNSYDLAGHLLQQTYPSGKSIAYTYTVGGRNDSFTGNLMASSNTAYMSAATYNPAGQMVREKLGTAGNGLYHANDYNNRFQMIETRVGIAPTASTDPAAWDHGRLRFYYNNQAVTTGNPNSDPSPTNDGNNGNVLRQEHWVPTAGSPAIPMQDNYGYVPPN